MGDSYVIKFIPHRCLCTTAFDRSEPACYGIESACNGGKIWETIKIWEQAGNLLKG